MRTYGFASRPPNYNFPLTKPIIPHWTAAVFNNNSYLSFFDLFLRLFTSYLHTVTKRLNFTETGAVKYTF